MSVIRKSVRFVALVVAVLGVYLALTTFEVWRVGRSSSTTKVDAIVVMGAAQYDGRPSRQLAARLDHVVELWELGIAPRVIVTGEINRATGSPKHPHRRTISSSAEYPKR